MFIIRTNPPAQLRLVALKRAILWTFNSYWLTWRPSSPFHTCDWPKFHPDFLYN